MLKIFSKKNKELISDVDIWIVEWKTYKSKYFDCTLGDIVPKYQPFTNYDEALEYKEALEKAIKLLGVTLPSVRLYKQDKHSL